MSVQTETLRAEAESLLRQGRHRDAADLYRRLLDIDPGLADCWYNLAWLMKRLGDFDAALDAYSRALERGVDQPEEVHLNRAVIYSDQLLRHEEAEAELRRALEIDPRYAPALLNLGNLHEERGERDQAASCYEQILSIGGEPPAASYYEALGRLAHLRPPSGAEDPLLVTLDREARSATAIDAVSRANLLFNLARALDSIGKYDDAFGAVEQANRIARTAGPSYKRGRERRRTDAIIEVFGEAAPAAAAGARLPRPEPVFICGMFRSGSTLVEQALAAHPAIVAGGELDFFPRLVHRLPAPFPVGAAALDETGARSLATQYQTYLLRLFPQADQETRYVTDKRPDNFVLLGLVKKLFPAAKIVHTMRNPLDTCLSIYFQHLAQGALSYASELGAVGHYYGEYRRLMAHWKKLFPNDIFDFDYDSFVQRPKQALEDLLQFLGLDWEDSCLDFHRLSRPVKTASYWQVRRPLYVDASGRWRNYRAHLGPLREALREGRVEVDED